MKVLCSQISLENADEAKLNRILSVTLLQEVE